jgi:predicted HicB family RNase H-like nuclease
MLTTGGPPMTALTIRLPDSVHLRIKQLAAREGVSVNQFLPVSARISAGRQR